MQKRIWTASRRRRGLFPSAGLGLVVAAVLATAGCAGEVGGGGGEAGESVEIDMATVYDAKSPQAVAAQRFADRVTEESGGELTVNFFPNGSLGTETDNFNAVSNGELGMVLGGSTGIDMFAPEFLFFQTPYMMKDVEHVRAFLESDLHDDMVAKMDQKNIHLLGHIERGWRNSTANKPFRTPEDLKGLKLRLPESPTWIAAWKALGVRATPVALPELYSALQTGVVEASEGPYEQFATFSLNEVQDYVINTEHIFEVTEFWIDKELYESLTDEQRGWIDDAAAEAVASGSEEAAEQSQVFLEQLTDAGMKVVDPDREALIEAARPALQQMFEDQFTVTTYDEVMQLAD
jgi:tripartite ATP-independent transporter DctP family solute receptor